MSKFECPIVKIENVRNHPDADRLDIVTVLGFDVVSGKGLWNIGDYAIYIPEAAVLPDHLCKFLNLEGKLAGSQKNRVRAIKLRGILSQGVLCPLSGWDGSVNPETDETWCEYAEEFKGTAESVLGVDASKVLGVTKYEPEIPIAMAGEVYAMHEYALKYDIENIKKYPDVIAPDENVYVTEKIHGTFFCILYAPEKNDPFMFYDTFACTSKGMLAQGLFLKNNEENKNNVYVRTLKNLLEENERFEYALKFTARTRKTKYIYLMGEIYGSGVQDLSYGLENGKTNVRFFDMKYESGWAEYDDLVDFCIISDTMMVPKFYSGKFSDIDFDNLFKKTSNVGNGNNNLLEGFVIRPEQERYDSKLGRVILKHINPDYLTRKNGTEYN